MLCKLDSKYTIRINAIKKIMRKTNSKAADYTFEFAVHIYLFHMYFYMPV